MLSTENKLCRLRGYYIELNAIQRKEMCLVCWEEKMAQFKVLDRVTSFRNK